MLAFILTFLAYGLKGALCYHSSIEYTFVDTASTWHEARAYCRKHHDDLITITSLKVNEVLLPESGCWIGLADLPSEWKGTMTNAPNSWRWSLTESFNSGGYQKWASEQPNNTHAIEHCVSMMDGQWDDVSCNSSLPFVCGKVPGSAEPYIFINETMTWAEAKTHCRQNHRDLAMILDETANSAVASVAPTTSTKVWIGLYRVPWAWSDGSAVSFTNWYSGYPDNINGNQYCARTNYLKNHQWKDNICTNRLPFFCQHAKTKATFFKLKLQSGADLSDPAVYNQVMQQFAAKLKAMGITDFKLVWKTSPTKK